jgi:hypothetical protein
MRHALWEWPRRRWIACVALAPILTATFVAMAGVPLGGHSLGWLTLVGLAAILSAGVLGSYVPQEGVRPDLGCAPCAVMPVATVAGALVAVSTYGAAIIGPTLAIALTLFGMTQRLSNVNSCVVLEDPPAGEPIRVPLRNGRHPDQ